MWNVYVSNQSEIVNHSSFFSNKNVLNLSIFLIVDCAAYLQTRSVAIVRHFCVIGNIRHNRPPRFSCIFRPQIYRVMWMPNIGKDFYLLLIFGSSLNHIISNCWPLCHKLLSFSSKLFHRSLQQQKAAHWRQPNQPRNTKRFVEKKLRGTLKYFFLYTKRK